MNRRALLYVCTAFATTINLPAVLAAPVTNKPATSATTRPASAVGAVAAEVNNEKILNADLERIVSSIRARESSLATGSPEAQTALDNIRDQILDNLITQRLLSQEARRRKITPAKKAVDDALQNIKGTADDAAFQQTLAREGKTVEDVRRIISEELAIRELTKQLTADVVVTEAEITKFYNENQDEFKIPEAVRPRHILLAVKPDATPAERQKVRVRAQALLKKAQASNADFSKLARENSDDKGSKDEGGNLGFSIRERLIGPWKPFADAVFAAPVGKVIGPVETEFGFHIIRIEEKKPARTIPLSAVHDNIEALLLRNKIKDRLEQRISTLRTQATIKKYL
jgi:peptidyl-prolyl cis-trans isomerase C